MNTLDANVCEENISLYKKLPTDRNISDGQRDVIGAMLADEEAKLLTLFSAEKSTTPAR